jgi:hypothetical protein
MDMVPASRHFFQLSLQRTMLPVRIKENAGKTGELLHIVYRPG